MPFIDNLNTLYVAFTRSKDELIVFSPRPKKMKDATGEVEKISTLTDACGLVWRLEADSFTGNTEMSSFHRSRKYRMEDMPVPLRTKMLITVLHLQLYSGAMVPLFSHKTAVRECRM